MTTTGPFSRTALAVVIGVAAASLGVAVVLTVLGDDLAATRSAGADSYSVSAIGHRGLVRLLERLDVPVIVSRSDSGARAGDGLLIVAEPTVTDAASRDRLAALVRSSRQTLLVLPKWYGAAERGKTWIADAHLLPADEVNRVVEVVGLGAPAAPAAPAVPAVIDRAAQPTDWVVEPGTAQPVIREPQVLVTQKLTAVVADRRGNPLLGWMLEGDTQITVLSDPDVLNNAGLREPGNARFMIDLVDALRGDGPVVIDETMHGYAQQPSLVRALLRFPLVLATLQVLVCAVLAVWAMMVRFGPRRAAPPPIAPGKDFLIRNTAALLHHGGHHGHALARYLQLTALAVRHALHAPALAPVAMTAWLERVRQVRGGTISLAELERAVETADAPARVVELADLVFRWRMEMTHGPDRRS